MEPQEPTATNSAQPSALQTLLTSSPTSNNNSSSDTAPSTPHDLLAMQILHNLQHQHLWTCLRIHKTSPLTSLPLPRPLISGLPPQRLYVHPDEQIALLQAQKKKGGEGMGVLKPEREWVCPSHIREKWSLRRFGDVFGGVGVVPPEFAGTAGAADEGDAEEGDGEDGKEVGNPWRTEKRVLLATVDDDSTVVYYIVHDGIVKPRQN